MKKLYISEILLLSQKEKKARAINFDRHRTLIHGKNHTGKSSLIKSIYRTFGAEPIMNARFIDANVISAVKFELDDVSYQIIRDGNKFAIFNVYDDLIDVFDSVTKKLAPFLGKLFDFKPLFRTNHNDFIIPPPAFLLLPFYVDQDDSWSSSWSSFKKLQQIKEYRTQCIDYHSGIRPNSYYDLKKDLDIYIKIIEETDKEQKITSNILDNIKSKLSQAQFNINIEDFKEEITELLLELEKIKIIEDKIKSDLHDLFHLRANYDIQIKIIKQAILESNKDLSFAISDLPNVIGCPTCGAEYENSFAERFEIAQDEQKSKDLLIDVKKEADEIEEKIKTESAKLSLTMSEAMRVDEILRQKKGELVFSDVIESSGKNQVKVIFAERYKELQRIIAENLAEKLKLEKQLKELESKKRREEINNYYRTKLTSYLKELDISSISESQFKKIQTKIESLETGSSKPRALIAYYFTFFHLMKKYSTSTYFPLIVDSPNQQDQDIEHIDKIMKFIDKNQPNDSQLILGLAETYGVDFKCKVIELEEKYSLLQKDEFESVKSKLDIKLFKMWE